MIVLAVHGMHCPACALTIDDELEAVPGVRRATTRYRRARTTVDADPAAVTAAQLLVAVAKAGYTATVLDWPGGTAEPDAY